MQSTEEYEQIAVVDYLDVKGIPVFHVPNEGKRSPKTGKRFKRMGMKPGVPDLCIPVARRGYHGLFIEMKYGSNKLTEKQAEWLTLLNENGYKAVCCYGFDDAMRAIDWYFGL